MMQASGRRLQEPIDFDTSAGMPYNVAGDRLTATFSGRNDAPFYILPLQLVQCLSSYAERGR